LVLCVAGMALAFPAHHRMAGAKFIVPIAFAYAGGVIMFFVSDRFRLPLLPFLCVGASCLGTRARSWFRSVISKHTAAAPAWRVFIPGRKVLAVTLATVLLTFSRAWGVHDLSPAVQDYLLLSIAEG